MPEDVRQHLDMDGVARRDFMIASATAVGTSAALALGAAGVLVLATAGSRVVAFAEETVTVGATADLVRVRAATGYRLAA